MIPPGRRIVGRAEGSDLRIADEHVSRTHAAIESAPGQISIEDLGSSGGTLVNGVPLQGLRRLHHGDLVRFGVVETRYEGPGQELDETIVGAAPQAFAEPAMPPVSPGARHYNVGYQQAGQLSNVAGNQYIQHIQAQRDSFFREIAAAKTRARRLIVVGLVLFLAGFGTCLWVIGHTFGAINRDISESFNNPEQPMPVETGPKDFFGPNVGGIPLAVIGEGLAALGVILMIVGLVLHIVAASRRKSFDERTRQAWSFVPPQHRA
jgi:hypothetical protein